VFPDGFGNFFQFLGQNHLQKFFRKLSGLYI